MTEKRNIGTEILDGIRELKAGEAGRVVNVPSVAEVREKTGLSQTRFAALLGVPVRTLQDWEQGAGLPRAPRAPSCRSRTGIRRLCSRWPDAHAQSRCRPGFPPLVPVDAGRPASMTSIPNPDRHCQRNGALHDDPRHSAQVLRED